MRGASSARAAPARAACAARPSSRASSSALAVASIQPVTSVSAGPPFGGLYLKPPLSGGLCEGVTTMPSASPRRAAAVVGENRVRDRRRRRVFVVLRDHARRRRWRPAPRARSPNAGARQRVRVDAEEQRPVDALPLPVLADRLGDRQHVPLVEAALERRAAMAGGAEGDALRRHRRDRAQRRSTRRPACATSTRSRGSARACRRAD